jgi:hypothetical protein
MFVCACVLFEDKHNTRVKRQARLRSCRSISRAWFGRASCGRGVPNCTTFEQQDNTHLISRSSASGK